jgi:sugar phosphate isomerase/epimerase
MGFDFAELFMEIPEGHYSILEGHKRDLLASLSAFSHPPVAHTAYWLELWSGYEEVRKAWVEVAKRTVDVAASLGCRKFNIHAPIPKGMYSHSMKHWKQALETEARSLREISEYASRRSIKLMLENLGPFGSDFPAFRHIVNRVPGLGVHLDVGHAFLEGGMKMVSRYIRTFRGKLEHFHFTDNMGLEDDHIGIGQGVIDYFKIMEIIRKIRYDKTITLEVFSSRKDLRNSLRIIRAIEEEVWQG